jgi:lipopolysaccharide export system protein LptA
MWTPKRIALLLLGFFVYFSGYLLYASCLGGIDGLPPLPLADYPPTGPRLPPLIGKVPMRLDQKLILAFGPDCREVNWALKLELNSKGMVVAARDFAIQKDGRLKLEMLSLALFGKDQNDGRPVEINTVRAKLAYLTFDKPLKDDKELGGRRIVAAELIGDDADNIEIVNNHRATARDRYLHAHMVKGPLYYDEAKSLIWTGDDITVEDDQNQPPTVVRGRGMEVRLTAAEPSPPRPDGRPPRGKPKSGGFTGVESIALKTNVDMNLYAAGGFLSGPPTDAARPAAKAPPAAAPAAKPAPPNNEQKDHINIYTLGRFEYQFRKDGDLAVFEAGAPDAAAPRQGPWDVKVTHDNALPDAKAPKCDQLICRRLELRLSRKETGPAGRDGAPAGHVLTIDGAHAVAADGDELVLTSDDQGLEAHGGDLTYDARTKVTVLSGDPKREGSGMWAKQEDDEKQEDNLIHARDMQIQEMQGADGKVWRQVTARGPGRLDLKPRPAAETAPAAGPPSGADNHPVVAANTAAKKGDERPIHATWQDRLTTTKDGAEDLLILSGAATFTDDEHQQTLRGETLKVWLTEPQAGPKTVPGPPGQQPARRPSRVEAVANVSVQSPQLNIPQAARLVIQFDDAPARSTLPAASPDTKGGPPAVAQHTPAGGGAEAAKPAAPTPPGAGPPAKESPEPDRPITLEGRSVYVWVARDGQKSTVERVDADGYVKVHQDPAEGDERGVDIVGQSLRLNYQPEGYYLEVSCDQSDPAQDDLAQLLMNQIYIVGDRIKIDQAANTVTVTDGPGAMRLQSKTDFQGKALDKPVPMWINWKKDMFFNGRFAEFSGNIQGEQEDAHLACQSLQVLFDHFISLKEGNRGGPPPRVKNLVCDRDVRVDNQTVEGGKVVRYQQIASRSLTMNPLEPDAPPPGPAPQRPAGDGNEILAPGPGEVRILQLGGQDPLAPPAAGGQVTSAKPPADDKAAKPNAVMKMTYISYGDDSDSGSMYANSKTKTATFTGKVRALNLPCTDPHMKIDLDAVRARMPEGAMYLEAQRLKVVDTGDEKKSQQEMTAEGRVSVQARDFWGHSAKLYYNEAKDQIIFEGGTDGLARLYRVRQKGAEPQKIEGKKITYIRSTGMFKIEGGEGISGN